MASLRTAFCQLCFLRLFGSAGAGGSDSGILLHMAGRREDRKIWEQGPRQGRKEKRGLGDIPVSIPAECV